MKNGKLIKGTVINRETLEEIIGKKQARKLTSKLEIFPTPFKEIYYIPFETERKAFYITYPYKVLFEAAKIYLNTPEIYYGLLTALYFLRIIWNPVPADIINKKTSKKIKIPKKPKKKYWRTEKKYKILIQYPYPINLHRIKKFNLKNTKRKEGIIYSSLKKTKKDAEYLCKKGSKQACNLLKNYSKYL